MQRIAAANSFRMGESEHIKPLSRIPTNGTSQNTTKQCMILPIKSVIKLNGKIDEILRTYNYCDAWRMNGACMYGTVQSDLHTAARIFIHEKEYKNYDDKRTHELMHIQ